ncbi:MAG: bifunctional metallophosphatase/5'-nucleotidase [Acholeplasmatales bacterium]|nr:MAG: bifunctional metallophosphatase/5'-nucleotidase [Acholeplasmatales bacterium]
MISKLRIMVWLGWLLLLTAACTTPNRDVEPITISHLDIFYLNDLHGQIEPEGARMGLPAIGHFLMTRQALFPEHTLILAGGDMVHGSALANLDYGRPVIELMQLIGFDAMVVGNHEFDWGLPVITQYFGAGGTDPIADFKLLGANIYEHAKGGLPETVEPYAIFTRGQLRIGVIGTIGYGLERSIAPQFVEGFAFLDPAPIVEDLARHLRAAHQVDVILLLTHDSGFVNPDVYQFPEDARVDVIFNAHSHQVFAYVEHGVAVIQSGDYGRFVGHVRFDLEGTRIRGMHLEQLTRENEPLLRYSQPDVERLLETYKQASDTYLNTPIIFNPETVERDALSRWMARLMRTVTHADIGLQNSGGTRMPFPGDTYLSMRHLYDVFPFDNTIKTVWLSGHDITQFLSRTNWRNYDTDIAYFEADKLYKVATNSFVFDQPHNPFLSGIDPEDTLMQQRDLVYTELSHQHTLYGYFSVTHTLLSAVLPGEVLPPETQP